MSNNKRVQVAQFNKDGDLLAKFQSLTEAALRSGTQVSHIGKVVNGKRKTAGGYIWAEAKRPSDKLTARTAGIRQTDKDGFVIAVYADAEIAASMNKASAKRIMSALSTNKIVAGYRWS